MATPAAVVAGSGNRIKASPMPPTIKLVVVFAIVVAVKKVAGYFPNRSKSFADFL